MTDEGPRSDPRPELPTQIRDLNDEALKVFLDEAKAAYQEVLDATKHQDDKIGRFLTAIAFLASGTIALMFRSDLQQISFSMGRGIVLHLPAILLTIFMVLVGATVALLVLSLGPNLTLPRLSREGRRGDSYLFFLSIASQTHHEWQELWFSNRSPTDLQRQLLDGYLSEAHNIANKTMFKYARTNEARALFFLALASFTAAVALAGSSLADQRYTVEKGVFLLWSLRPRLILAGVLAFFCACAGYDWYRQGQTVQSLCNDGKGKERGSEGDEEDEVPGGPAGRRKAIAVITTMAVVYVLGVVIPYRGWQRWVTLAAAVAGIGVVLLAVRFVRGRSKEKIELLHVGMLILLLLLLAAPIVTTLLGKPQFNLLAAVTPLVALEVPRLAKASLTWREQRNRIREFSQ